MYINERITQLKLKIDTGYLVIIGVYTPEEGKKEVTDFLYEKLQKLINSCTRIDHLIVLGDFNAHVGKEPILQTLAEVGGYINKNGHKLRNFATSNKVKITNTFFRKEDINKCTWCARGSRSLIDYILVNKKLNPEVRDIVVCRGCDIYSDHYLVVSTISLLEIW
jgi:endonuclease/exonuclease/phosphatase family metal-dependent hydrolase